MKIKILFLLGLSILLLGGCDLKVNINSNSNQIPEVSITANTNSTTPANVNVAPVVSSELDIIASAENQITQIKDKKTGEVILENLKDLCGTDVMLFAQPEAGTLILKPFNPGSDQPVKELFVLNVVKKTCAKLVSSKELSDFGARVLSSDQTKLAVALETNEARELKLIDLLKDTSKVLVTLPEGETFNGGYGALSDHFDIKWLDNQTIQYTVYKDTVKNYDVNAPTGLEDVLQVRVVKIE
ncbi:MAG: hypothetical protein PHC97_04705 [Patescibacteria group bacterium]|nr:hypothetical protein [Patescibacteria group bacterium]